MSARRSWLFVPGDSEKKQGKALDLRADALILDLEDSVVPEARPEARRLTADFIAAHRAGAASALWVRINPLDSEDAMLDLDAVMAAGPAGIMLPKASGPRQVAELAAHIDARESRHGLPQGRTRILPLVSETPAAAATIHHYAEATLPRVAGLTWGAEDLSAELGASRKRGAEGQWTSIYAMVRAQTLLAAHAMGVAAIETLHADFRDSDGLVACAETAKADGFTGMLAIHPAQVAPINAAFAPSEAEIAHARAVLAAFGAQPGAGTVSLDGQMLDKPHLKLAQRILSQAG